MSFCRGLIVRGFGLFSLASLLAAGAAAQSGEMPSGGITGAKSVEVPRLDQRPEIDGFLNEEVWSRAALVSDFHQVEPFEYSEPSQPTEVRLFYTEDALYVAARMFERDPSQINASILRQGQGLGPDDVFVLILDPYLDRRNGYQFEVNANGIRVEGLFQNVTDVERNWIGIWETRTSIDEEGWIAEIRIPFQTISFDPSSEAWGINFRRSIRRSNEDIAWVSRNRQVNPSIAGTATGFRGLEQGLGLDVVPYVVMRQEKRFGPLGYEEQTIEPQVDLFYKVTPQLNAALTINTDFSATEVDDRQVNLKRFSLFFPERRDFFTRDADIFEFGQIGTGNFNRDAGGGNPAIPGAASQNGRPFFSRRIGLSRLGGPVDINAGAKLSGRVGDWNVGSLVVSQEEDELTGVDSQTVFVGRAALNVLSESQWGLIATHGDPQSNQENTLVGTDFRYRNTRLPGGRTVESTAWYQRTDTEGVSGDDAAYGFSLGMPQNVGWRGEYRYKRIGENFDPALGFVNQTDVQDHGLTFGYRHFYQPGGAFRSLYGGFDGYRSEDLSSGMVISENLGLRLTGNNNSGDNMFSRLMVSREVLPRDFTIWRSSDGLRSVTIPAGDYSFNEVMWGLDLADQRMISGRLSMRGGEYYNGNRFQRGAQINFRPSAGYQFGAQYTENEIHLPAGNFTVRQITLSSQVSFSATMTWSNLVQYDNVSELIGLNSRLNWIPQAGRQAFVVLNYGLEDFDRDNSYESVNYDLSVKFNYTFRF